MLYYGELSLHPIIDCIDRSAKIVMGFYNSLSYQSELKEDNSPLTEADLASNKEITDFLLSYTPDIPILSEEMQIPGYEIRRHWNKLWIIDPLDGTKEFIERTDEFTINLAMIENNEPVIGIIAIPCQNIIFIGIKSVGLFKYTEGRIEICNKKNIVKSTLLRVGTSRSHIDPLTEKYLEKLGPHIKVPLGSSLKFIALVNGEIDCYPRCQNIMEWDTAAGQAIIESTGRKMIDIGTGNAIKYNKEDLRNPFFLAE